MKILINFNMLNQIHKPQAVWACIFALGLSFSIVAGWLYDKTSFLAFTPISVVVFVVLFLVLIVPFYALFVFTTCARVACEHTTCRRINIARRKRERERE